MTYQTKKDLIDFEGDKTLYHYTSISTALENIFKYSELRLSPLILASDPMEKDPPSPISGSYGDDEFIRKLDLTIDKVGISQKITNYYKRLRQLCLCRNSEDTMEEYYSGAIESMDYFGFAKPRMWDQYGDRFSGVCIAISRSKIEKQLSSEYKIMNVEYLKNQFFKTNVDTIGVDLNRINQIGETEYLTLKK